VTTSASFARAAANSRSSSSISGCLGFVTNAIFLAAGAYAPGRNERGSGWL
jgi:hypothetical protein